MNKDELLDNVQRLLRKAIAARLKIARADYDASLDTQTAVNRCLTNVMALGYNRDINAAVQDLCETRFFGDEIDEKLREAIQTEVVATYNTFSLEVAAFARMHELNLANVDAAEIWTCIQPMVSITADYRS